MVSKLNVNIIDTHDFKTLGVVDVSWYNPLIKIEEVTMEITLPGHSEAVKPAFSPKSLNIYNSNALGLTDASCEGELIDLPDGIWKVKYSICPNDKLFIEKFFLKIDKLQCRYTQAFLTLDLKCSTCSGDKEKRRRLDEIEFFMKSAIAASNNQNAKDAHDFYVKADKLLSNYLEGSDICGC